MQTELEEYAEIVDELLETYGTAGSLIPLRIPLRAQRHAPELNGTYGCGTYG